MDYKATAAEIYALPSHKRKVRVQELPEDQRGLVWMYMDRLARMAHKENGRRVMAKLNPRGGK